MMEPLPGGGRPRRLGIAALSIALVVGLGVLIGVGFVGTAAADAPDCSTVSYNTNGSGYYEISTVDQLQCIGENHGSASSQSDALSSDYVLVADVDADGTSSWNGGDGFEPIGDSASDFSGTFDGNGYAVSNLSVDRAGEDYVGVFAETGSDGVVRDVRLSNVDVTGSRLVGGVVGNNFGTVTGVSVSGRVEIPGSDRHVGGIVGWNYGRVADSTASVDVAGDLNVGGAVGRSGGNVSNVSASGTASGQDRIGGLVGLNGGNVTDSSASGNVSGGPNVGGLVGINDRTVERSYATGDANGSSRVGGLVGRDDGDLTDSYATGNVTGIFESTGGLVGWNYQGKITTSYATGDVEADRGGAGLVGENGGTVTDSYWDTQRTGQDSSAGGTGLTTREMTGGRADSNVGGFDFSGTWQTVADSPGETGYGVSYPVLGSNTQSPAPGSTLYAGGDGSESNPYEIETWYHLDSVRENLDANFTLVADLDESTAGYNAVVSDPSKGFDPIGDSGGLFTGTLDGDGHTISDLYIDRGSNYVGLFGVVSGGTVEDVGVENVEINGSEYVGGLVGRNNAAVTKSYATGDVNGSNFVGGLVGGNLDDVTESYATADVNGTRNVGGLVGENEGDVTESYATGDVNGDEDYVGGLVGLNYGNVTESYATGDADGDVVGGLVGFNDVDSGVANSNGYVANSYATGDINGSSNDVGGLVGFNPDGTVEDAYWDTGTTNQSDPIGASNSGTKSDLTGFGETDDTEPAPEMQGINATVEMHRLDFESAWRPGDGDDQYPDLAWDSSFGGSADAFDSLVAGDGSSGSPYEIEHVHDLQAIRERLGNGEHFQLANDIDATATSSWFGGKGFEPIGTATSSFNGTLAGANNTISNATIDRGSTSDLGLIGYTETGTVENVGVVNATIVGASGIGVLVGTNNGTVRHAYATGTVSGTNGLGGLVGVNRGTVETAYAVVDVSGSGEYIGGLVGLGRGRIADVYAAGSVSGGTNVGGLLGFDDSSTEQDSYWDVRRTGQETSAGDAVGLFTRDMVGANALDSANMSGLSVPPWGTVTASTPGADDDGYPILQGLDPESQILTPDASVSNGIFVDVLDGGEIVLDFEASDTVRSVKETLETRTGLAADQQDLFFKNRILEDGRTLSDYNVQKGSTVVQESLYAGGDGTETTPYEIATWIHLDNVRHNLGASFTLVNDLDETTAGYNNVANASANGGKGFEPIGDSSSYFSGTFDGNGYAISNLTIDRGNTYYVGLFGFVRSGGRIENVGVENVSITGKRYVGGLVGYKDGPVTGSYATGDVDGRLRVGGLVGYHFGPIDESYAAVDVDGTGLVGGLVGASNGPLSESYATGDVAGSGDDVGGLVGVNNNPGGGVTSSYATGDVDGTENVGGLVGRNFVGGVTRSYATGDVGGSTAVGGLVGENWGTVTDSYWDEDTTGQSSSAGSPDENGLTTTQMQRFAPQSNMGALDFQTVWTVTEGYPRLQWEGVSAITLDSLSVADASTNESESGTITVTATANGRNAGEGVTVAVAGNDSLGGLQSGATAVTNESGQATFAFTEAKPGEYAPEFAWADDGSVSATAGVTVNAVPVVSGIAPGTGQPSPTNADSVAFTVTFSESVDGVEASDFAVRTVSGDVSGSVAGVDTSSGTTITVTADGVTGDGVLSVALNDDDGITDADDAPLAGPGTEGGADGSYVGTAGVTVDNTAPTFETGADTATSIPEGTTGSVLDTDAADSAGTADANVSYALGGPDAPAFGVDPDTGEVRLDAELDFERPTDADGDSEYELTVTATDDVGNAATQNVTVSVTDVDEPPRALQDAYGVSVGGVLVVDAGSGVLANDRDEDDDAANLSVRVVGGVENGTLSLAANGSFRYEPEDGFDGTDSFTYAVTDDAGGTDRATVTISTQNDPPTARVSTSHVVESGETVRLDGSGSRDPNGDSLSYDWTQTRGPDVDLSGTDSSVAMFNAPETDATTTLGFGLSVSDGKLGAATVVVVTVEPGNRPPVADAGPNATVAAGETATLDASGSTDPDGDALAYEWTQTGGPDVSVTDWGRTPSFEAPTVSGNATATFRVTVSDGDATDTDTVAIRIRPGETPNAPPTAVTGENRTVTAGTSVTLDARNSTDPDGDALAYEWVQTGGPAVTLSGANTATPTFTAPATNATETLSFRLTVSDGNASASATVVVTVGHREGILARFDADDSGEIETDELQTAIRTWATGGIPTEELRAVIRAWARAG